MVLFTILHMKQSTPKDPRVTCTPHAGGFVVEGNLDGMMHPFLPPDFLALPFSCKFELVSRRGGRYNLVCVGAVVVPSSVLKIFNSGSRKKGYESTNSECSSTK